MKSRTAVGRALLVAATTALVSLTPGTALADEATAPAAASPIQHFVYLMQGDRTFDNYFGTYPGADGIPTGTCQLFVPGQPNKGCVAPFELQPGTDASLAAGPELINQQWDKGSMDQFVAAYHSQARDGSTAMGYYDDTALPYYWQLAKNYVLFDKFFSSTRLGENNNRNQWVTAASIPTGSTGGYTQATIFDRLQAAGVSWKFYVQGYDPQKTYRAAAKDSAVTQNVRVPLLNQDRFIDDPAFSSHIVDMDQYYADLLSGNLPAVSFMSSSTATERSGSSIDSGQQLVSNLVTQLMLSKYWSSSALMVSYDGSGGWFDHVTPPQVDGDGYGLRVPAMLVSPYAQKGAVNSTVLDSSGALAFIEHNWNVAPLTSRDANAQSIDSAFDFAAGPRPASLLPSASTLLANTAATPAKSTQNTGVAASAIYGTYGAAAGIVILLTLLASIIPVWRRAVRRAEHGKHSEQQPEEVLTP
jgi:phospholipase C